MKRLLISSLLGCMLMSQVNASDFRNQLVAGVTNALSEVGTKAGALDFTAGAIVASLALLAPRTIVMFDSAPVEYKDALMPHDSKIPCYLKYLLPSNRLTKNMLEHCAGYSANTISSIENDKNYQAADNRNINWNRIAALFSTLFFGASVAKLCGWQGMPTIANNLLGSKLTTIGLATGSAASLGLLAFC